jgi:hypothetical protein
VGLLSLATAVVLLAVSLADVLVLSAAALLALACGWASLRIVWTEVRQSRRFHAADRAAQARAFRELVTEKSAEHAVFAAAMTDRLVARNREVEKLSDALQRYAERAAEAEERVRREARRVAEAQQRVHELQTAFAVRAAEQADGLAGRRAGRASRRPDAGPQHGMVRQERGTDSVVEARADLEPA